MEFNEQFYICISIKGPAAVCQLRNILEPSGRASRGQTEWDTGFARAYNNGRMPIIMFKNIQLSFSSYFFNGSMQFQSVDDAHSNNNPTEIHYLGNLMDLFDNEIVKA